MVREAPDGSKPPQKVPSGIMDATTTREVYGDDSFGEPYRFDDANMQEIFQLVLEDILLLLNCKI